MLTLWKVVALAVPLCAPCLRVAGDCSIPPLYMPLGDCHAQPHDAITTTAQSWGVRVTVGNQELCVSPSTGARPRFYIGRR